MGTSNKSLALNQMSGLSGRQRFLVAHLRAGILPLANEVGWLKHIQEENQLCKLCVLGEVKWVSFSFVMYIFWQFKRLNVPWIGSTKPWNNNAILPTTNNSHWKHTLHTKHKHTFSKPHTKSMFDLAKYSVVSGNVGFFSDLWRT